MLLQRRFRSASEVARPLWHSVLASIGTLYAALQLGGEGDATECIAQKQQTISDFHVQLTPTLNSLGEAGAIVSKYVRRAPTSLHYKRSRGIYWSSPRVPPVAP